MRKKHEIFAGPSWNKFQVDKKTKKRDLLLSKLINMFSRKKKLRKIRLEESQCDINRNTTSMLLHTNIIMQICNK